MNILFELKQNLRTTETEFVNSSSNLKYVGIFDYIEDMVFMTKKNKAIYARIAYFEKGI